MAKGDRAPAAMDPFSTAQQADEGYSEDPLNPMLSQNLAAPISSLPPPADLSAWLASHASALPTPVKTGPRCPAPSPRPRLRLLADPCCRQS